MPASTVRKLVELKEFVGFNVNNNCFIDILQFAEDAVLVGDGSWKHIWAVKSVLRGFKLVSGLGIDFHKSKFIDINISLSFLEASATFLSCRTEEKEFTFLSIPIGSNPRRISSWLPLFAKLRKGLSSWKGHFLNFGGKIALLKSVLSSLLIFHLSFNKALVKIQHKIVRFKVGSFKEVQRSEVGYIGVLFVYLSKKARYGDIMLQMSHLVKDLNMEGSRNYLGGWICFLIIKSGFHFPYGPVNRDNKALC
ncbi:uncharacterized protein LOC131596879 [Vicia villosa]|uniref:uncharacterized protein LOC131596879 n=1 Tax=Vicia villosa TaxID=3911 RepID=UPI00273AD2B6|nr:uncharacterized protein LOC131596879 [Vicia villosa]